MSLSIDEKLAGLSETSNNQFIFRVHQRLRSQNEEAYEPEMLSIGPYHHGKENLKKMEMYKLKYLQGILKRQGEGSAERYIDALRKVEKEARDCYAEDLRLRRDDFVEMMLLDGCFIIEFLRKNKGIVEILKDDLIFSVEWYRQIVRRDLLLFENQLPFFILELLFDMTKIGNHPEDHLIFLSISSLRNCFAAEASYDVINGPRNRAFHLLRLMHESWCSSFPKERDTQEEGGRQSRCMPFYNMLHCRKEQGQDPTKMEFIKSVCELKEYGIKFKKADKSRSWLNIKFENGIMQIPTLVIADRIDSILRNLIAYEQYMSVLAGNSRRVVTDFVAFIDRLINSSKDVQMLCHEKIISNWLGSDEELSNMINKISTNVFLSHEEFTYRKVFDDVNEHCSKRWHTWIALLKKKYFHNPWSIISVSAAIILLALTLVQTIFTVL